MFLHTNLSPKWSLEIPAEFGYYNRRWQVSAQPMSYSKLTFSDASLTQKVSSCSCVLISLCIMRVLESLTHNASIVGGVIGSYKLLNIGWLYAHTGLTAWQWYLSDHFAKVAPRPWGWNLWDLSWSTLCWFLGPVCCHTRVWSEDGHSEANASGAKSFRKHWGLDKFLSSPQQWHWL